ncbi:hypothetical protein BBO99_00004537 [Phytophthora kernoviae]|uniref:UV excision repair protein RAD23 n=2 Tax=Phytophthora kernoviae TaxID=325452 RepID=A0A3F2RU05_9STRA|nr:hypothetical protein G195_005521 [Phytophthora kernoviae 00238/432]KAG2524794.1 hypothetical protein JM16_004317 [Phytophthora kernoviae]KAG2526466.1 hypothetical protein JM18_003868 [Phytophthora kernoviae]RLM96120.1 hypothetical protein BBI17_004663 [Phytophthora kernoviae]RLN64229.1 hypothetical protein BBP00_00003603 [Phytophthora kernoviae]
MKLTVKTLQGVAFPLDAELTDTVVEVKQKIEGLQTFPVAQQKLIHAGKVLKDDSTLAEYNSNPAALPAVLQQIGAQSPELLRLIHQNQDRFVQMLNEPIGTRETGGGMEGMGGGAGAGAGGHRIMLSEEEAAAVDRLCEMGFERTDVIQAYLACDKNEALAANFLMDSGDFGGGATGGAGGQGDDNDDIYG